MFFIAADTVTAQNIKLEGMQKSIDSTSNFWSEYAAKCNSWNLSKDAVIKIIQSRKKITKFDFNYFYDVIPCSYEGEVVISNKRFHYQINGGSFLILSTGNIYLYYGCYNQQTKRFFIVPPANKEGM